jgi:hypothetical protein
MKTSCILLLVVCSLVIASCKKDKLEDGKENLIGSWNWIYTQHTSGWCQYDAFYETETPTTVGKNYRVEFLKKGKVNYYEDDKLTERHRIVFNYFEQGADGASYFYFYLDNNLEQGMGGSIHGDTLHFDYPLVESDPNCENYLNCFVRE